MRSIRAPQWFIRKENWLQQCKSLFTFLPLCLLVRRYLRLKKHSWLSKKFSEKTKSTRWGVRITALRSTIVRRKNKKLCCGVQMQSKSQVSMHVLKINRGLQSARRNKLHQFQSVVSRDMTPPSESTPTEIKFYLGNNVTRMSLIVRICHANKQGPSTLCKKTHSLRHCLGRGALLSLVKQATLASRSIPQTLKNILFMPTVIYHGSIIPWNV